MSEEAIKLLKEIEWSADFGRKCPICGWKKDKHHDNCSLAKAISLLKSQPTRAEIDSMVSAWDGDISFERARELLIASRNLSDAVTQTCFEDAGQPGEFTRPLREAWRSHGYADGDGPVKPLVEACDLIDRLTAELAEAKKTPEPGEFRKQCAEIREIYLQEPCKTMEAAHWLVKQLAKKLSDACDLIDRRETAIEHLTAKDRVTEANLRNMDADNQVLQHNVNRLTAQVKSQRANSQYSIVNSQSKPEA